jgi:hypothetical protein
MNDGGGTAMLVVLSERCANGHEWGPGLIVVSWTPCDCPPAVADRGEYAGAGHQVVYCNAAEGCRSAWYKPRHEPGAQPEARRSLA